MMLDAFFVALAVFVGVAGHELWNGNVEQTDRSGTAGRTALGDVQTGLIVGASLESILWEL